MSRLIGLLGVLLVCLSLPTLAHNRSESFSHWNWQDGELSYRYSVLQREATRIPSQRQDEQQLAQRLATHLKDKIHIIQISQDNVGQPCKVSQAATVLASAEGYLQIEGRFACVPMAAPLKAISIENHGLFDLASNHSHYARLKWQGQVRERVFSSSQRQHTLFLGGENTAGSNHSSFLRFVWIGAEHILQGWDHLAFVLGLLLLAVGLRQIAWLVTGFTLGHSLSLALAVLGFAEPFGQWVEALIGFTIALVVVEAAFIKAGGNIHRGYLFLPLLCLLLLPLVYAQHRLLLLGVAGIGVFSACYLRLGQQLAAVQQHYLRLLITTVFGLIHGFGFASGLLETDFSQSQLAWVLLGFNLGVELGQLLVIALLLVALYLFKRTLPLTLLHPAGLGLQAGLAGLGVFWFVSRVVA